MVKKRSISLLTVAILSFGILAHAQDAKPESTECTWSMPKVGEHLKPGDPIRVSPSVSRVFVSASPAVVNPNPEFKGLVVLMIVVDENGKVSDACAVRSPDPALVKPAIDTVRNWTFTPYLLNRKPVRIQTVVGLRFKKKIEFEPLPGSIDR